jgi:hypothetical protein
MELLVHRWRVLKSCRMRHDEAGIDIPGFVFFMSGFV